MANHKYKNLVGKRFGRLMVLSRAENKGKHIYWNCKCDCGEIKKIRGDSLIEGKTTSCGCFNNEKCRKLGQSHSGINTYELCEEYAIGRDQVGNAFIVDIDEIEHLKTRYWLKGAHGYFVSGWGNDRIFMHRFITKAPFGSDVDHVNHNVADNRHSNLRICSHMQNLWNSNMPKTNTSGIKGVHFDKDRIKWVARLTCNSIPHIKRFDSIEEAICQRKEWEQEFYGEYAPQLEN